MNSNPIDELGVRGLTDAELVARYDCLVAEKRVVGDLVRESKTPFAKKAIKAQKEYLQTIVDKYGKMKLSDRQPSDVVAELSHLQGIEFATRQTIGRWENAESYKLALDKEIELCETAIKDRNIQR